MNTAISHQTTSDIPYDSTTKQLVLATKDRLQKNEHLIFPLPETMDLVDELASFSLGRFLLHNRGLNGYWTSYIFRNEPNNSVNTLENWLLNESLYVMARERFFRFQQQIQKRVAANQTLASIPCGLMDDLLTLDYSSYPSIQLVGIDTDPESLEFARQSAIEKKFSLKHLCLLEKDAWNLGVENAFDLITSNGLNMYESSANRLIELYQNFYQALKPQGTLLISFIPPPPENIDSLITPENFLRERAIFGDIIQINYLNFCREEEMKNQLEIVGFIIEDIQYNDKGMAPIVVAKKEIS